jgi:hypothetical protein
MGRWGGERGIRIVTRPSALLGSSALWVLTRSIVLLGSSSFRGDSVFSALEDQSIPLLRFLANGIHVFEGHSLWMGSWPLHCKPAFG